eukprot:CAMPEP_0181316076 /NCGR_PEP_ID=MMETSP1101-20121128/15704_1 /TAXON_ID=46948 /ORGANISM="Rhodomonas abbreviata, Strain Caron Lab Isolate" /LENGTH=910 /DNA_ID=CAMNT_0023423303 /DNA_START=113 /DNA_END=2845 /DNA_ORIENTATION=+
MADFLQMDLLQEVSKTFSSLLQVTGLETAEATHRPSRIGDGSANTVLPPPPPLRRRRKARAVRVTVSGRAFGEEAVEEGEDANKDGEDANKEGEGEDANEDGEEIAGNEAAAGTENVEMGQSSEDDAGITSEEIENADSDADEEGGEDGDGGRRSSVQLGTISGYILNRAPKPTRRASAVCIGPRPKQGKQVWNGHEWVEMTLEMFKGSKFTKVLDKQSDKFYWACYEKGIAVWDEPIKILYRAAVHRISRKDYSKAKDILEYVVSKTKENSETQLAAKQGIHECNRHAGVKRSKHKNKTPYNYDANSASDCWDGETWLENTLERALDDKGWTKSIAAKNGKPYWCYEADGLVSWYDPKYFVCDVAITRMNDKDFHGAKELFDIAKSRCEDGEKLPAHIRTEIRTNNYFLRIPDEPGDEASLVNFGSFKSQKDDDAWPFPKPLQGSDVWDGVAWSEMTVEFAMADGWKTGEDKVLKLDYFSNKKLSLVTWRNPRETIYEEGKRLWKLKKLKESRVHFLRVHEYSERMGGGVYKATPLYLDRIREKLKKKEEKEREQRHLQRRSAGEDSDSDDEEGRKRRRSKRGRRGSQLSGESGEVEVPKYLPRPLRLSDYWDGKMWHHMNKTEALRGTWIERVHPVDHRRYWTNDESRYLTWAEPPPPKWFQYMEGKQLFRKKEYRKCQEMMQQYNDPGYHYTQEYLDIAHRHILDAKRREECELVYQDGKQLYERQKYEEAHHCFEVVQVLAKGKPYHHTEKYLEVCKLHMTVKQEKQETQQRMQSRVTSQYFSQNVRNSAAALDHFEHSQSVLKGATKWEIPSEPTDGLLPPPPNIGLQALLGPPPQRDDDDEEEEDSDSDESGEWEWEEGWEEEEQSLPPSSIPWLPFSFGPQSEPPSLRSSQGGWGEPDAGSTA